MSKELTFFRERLDPGEASPFSFPVFNSPRERPLLVRRTSPPAPGPGEPTGEGEGEGEVEGEGATPGGGAPLREGGAALLGGGALRSAEELELWEGSEGWGGEDGALNGCEGSISELL